MKIEILGILRLTTASLLVDRESAKKVFQSSFFNDGESK